MNIITIFLLLYINSANAAFLFDSMTGFSSSSDSKTSTNLSDLTNHIFIGASIGAKQRAYIGQNITIVSHQMKAAGTDKISTLELGPKLMYFFDEENIFYGSFGWNPYVKGTRSISGSTSEIMGYSLLASLGAELKINRTFHIGGSINYHQLKTSKSISSANVSTTESETYSSLMPMINVSLRFR
jgi:hypothetical protein